MSRFPSLHPGEIQAVEFTPVNNDIGSATMARIMARSTSLCSHRGLNGDLMRRLFPEEDQITVPGGTTFYCGKVPG